jgi:hypothetical protein
MKTLNTLAGCALAMVFAGSAFAATDLHVRINLGNAPPPPVVVVQHAPRMEWMPESRVYVVNDRDYDDDYFQCGAFWYSYHDGWWYRGRSWRGPFAVIDYRDVPQSIVVVPERHWRHHYDGPPAWGRQRRETVVENRGPVIVRERGRGHDRDDDRGHGRGHGKGHDRDRD